MFRTPAKSRRAIVSSPEDTSPKETRGSKVTPVRRSPEPRLERVEALSVARSSGLKLKMTPSRVTKRIILPVTPMVPHDESISPDEEEDIELSKGKKCLLKVQELMNSIRNLKSNTKAEVIEEAEKLYELVKQAKAERDYMEKVMLDGVDFKEREDADEVRRENHEKEVIKQLNAHTDLLEKNSKELEENRKELEKLNLEMAKQREEWKAERSYAHVVAGSPTAGRKEAEMHSVVITSANENATGEQIFESFRKALNAREEGIRVDNIRKAKDRKVIVSCKSKEELGKIKNKVQSAGRDLKIEDIKNKEPMILLRDVLKINTDEEIVRAILRQNGHILEGVSVSEGDLKIKFRRRARNTLTSHVAVQVPPPVWKRFTEAGALHIDVQKVRVEDQSPLIQCSRCLGYGHGRRFCRETEDACSHCGGCHHRSQCAEWMARAPPSCCNCAKARIGSTEHNAFSPECPVRRKWESLARSTVAYC